MAVILNWSQAKKLLILSRWFHFFLISRHEYKLNALVCRFFLTTTLFWTCHRFVQIIPFTKPILSFLLLFTLNTHMHTHIHTRTHTAYTDSHTQPDAQTLAKLKWRCEKKITENNISLKHFAPQSAGRLSLQPKGPGPASMGSSQPSRGGS